MNAVINNADQISLIDLTIQEAELLMSAALYFAEQHATNARHRQLLRRIAMQIDPLLPREIESSNQPKLTGSTAH